MQLDAGSSAADKSALTTVPQLSNASLSTAAADLPGGRLFALLNNGHVHVWDLHLTRPPALAEVWTHLDKDKCCSLVFMDGGSIDPAVAKTLGLSMKGRQITGSQPPSERESTTEATTPAGAGEGQPSVDNPQHEVTSDGLNGTILEDECRPLSAHSDTAAAAAGGEASSSCHSGSSLAAVEDHVLIGTRKGEVLVCDAARQGLVVLRIPAIKLLPVKVLLVDLDLNRLIVSGGNVVKIWDLTELVCIAEFEAKSEFLCGHILEGRLLLGSASGKCYMLDLATGEPVTAPPAAAAAGRLAGAVTDAAVAAGAAGVGSSDHDGPVMCISGSVYLQHYVTASQDGYVKVYDRDRRLKASLYLASPLLAAAFLNDEGDVVVAPTGAKQLLVVRADTYAVTARTRRDQKDISIFDDLKGRANATPRALLRNMTCKLQALATTPGPVPLARYPAPLSIGSSTSIPTATTKITTSHGQSNLNPGVVPPWGLPTPMGVKPEFSLQQPEVIQSSSRPPVDLDQNRLRADVARAAVPASKARRMCTLGRAVLSLQQQQLEEEWEEVEEVQQGVDGAHAIAGAVAAATAGGTASEIQGGSRSSRVVFDASVSQSLQQQQQQQPTGSLPQQRQPVILVAGPTVSTEVLEQQQQQSVIAGVAAAAAVSPNRPHVRVEDPAATETHPSAAIVQQLGLSAASKNKGGRSAITSSSSTGGSRWNTTVEYDLKALKQHVQQQHVHQQHMHQGHNKQKGETSSSDSDSASEDDSSNTGSSGSSSKGLESLERDYAVALAAAAAGGTNLASDDVRRIGQLNIRLPNSTAGLSGALQSQHQQQPGLSASSSSKQREPKLQGLQPAMRRAVAVVENPDVFMEDVPIPADLQLLLDRYQAEMATKGTKKKKKKKKSKKDATSADAQSKQNTKKKQKKTSAEGAVAGSKSSKPHRGKKGKQVAYTSALDYLMHTVSDPAVLVELKEAEAHESRQAALVRQWLAVGASGTPRRPGLDTDAVGSTSRRGVPPISTSGGVLKLLESMKLTNRSAVEQQPLDEDGLLRLDALTRAAP